jgi:hypothetical protein
VTADPLGDGSHSCSGPVFVVGSMRSGSTMLRLILDSHPDIAIGGETGFMGAVLATKQIPSWNFGKGWYERLGWTESELDERLRDFYGGLFERHARSQGKPRWGEKTPFHTAHMPEMARLFPDARIIGIVRHPGAVAASLRKRFHYTFAEALDYWSATNVEMVRAGAELGDRFAACRYEDLVVEEEAVLREVLAHLGAPWSEDVLEHHRVHKARGTPRAAEGSTVAHDAVDASRAAQWTADVSTEDRRDLARVTGLAELLGYDVLDPAPTRRLLPDEDDPRWLASGSDLAALRRSWAGAVDFDAQPVVPLVDASPAELARQLSRAEQALARVRSRRAVRWVDALRKVQHGRSLADLRSAWSVVAGPQRHGRS